MQSVKEKALELLRSGKVQRVLGWKTGEFFYDLTPAVFSTVGEVERDFAYNLFSGANLSKYLISESKKEGKIGVFLKPCDSFSFVQLQNEHRILRENVYAVGVQCDGKCDGESLRAAGFEGLLGIDEGETLTVHTLYGDKTAHVQDVLLTKCRDCKSKRIADFDELLCEEGEDVPSQRLAEVSRLEAMTPEERFSFWQSQLSKCIRCNACRNVCPACSCETCVFDNPLSGVQNKAAANSFEEQLFHIIRAFHVAGRCTDCGECSRVCPQHIPLHLLNRKLIKDMNELYGSYQAGAALGGRPPILDYRTDDPEPSVIYSRGGAAK